MRIDTEVKRLVEDIVDTVAGDNYEGWEDYWEDQSCAVDNVLEALKEWESLCKDKIIK